MLTAGESHGKSLTLILDGFPAGVPVTAEKINARLSERQKGYGRGGRMKIEQDQAEILSGIRYGKTIGSPISLLIRNNDWLNHQDMMSIDPIDNPEKRITVPRPGHADYTGAVKYGFTDIRNSIERSSARETAARVAAGAIAEHLLDAFGITVSGLVESIGGIYALNDVYERFCDTGIIEYDVSQVERSPLRVVDEAQENAIIGLVRKIKKSGDTLGGTFITYAKGVPAGLGSFMQYDRRLDAALTKAVMSINAVKAVEIGLGFAAASRPGSLAHDGFSIDAAQQITRTSNRAGGIEGGISNGMPLLIRAAMKPIATLMQPLPSVDLATMELVESRRERSDILAVPSCSVIAEAMVRWVLAEFMTEKFTGDALHEMKRNYLAYKNEMMKPMREPEAEN